MVVTVVAEPAKRTVDTYLDTDDWRVGRSGFVLRVRHQDDMTEVTLKDTSPAVAGLRRRLELTESLPPEGISALNVHGPVGRRLRSLVGDAPLIHLLEVRTRRHPYRLQAFDEFLGEVDLDDTIIVIGDDQYPARMRRVEVEADAAWVDLLGPLVEQLRLDCSLQPALLSKFEVGMLAAGLQIPTLPDLGPTAIGADVSIGTLAFAVLRRHLTAMLEHEAGTRLGEDIEQLHDMRVATRRLRAASALFADVLSAQGRVLRDELGWLASELGAVRDLDVQLETLDGWRHSLSADDAAALVDLSSVLATERDVARASLLRSLDSPRYEKMVADFTALVRPGLAKGSAAQSANAGAPAAAVVPGLILARHKAAARAARRARRSGNPEDFHRLRIRCKRLRYALEFVSEIYGGKTRPVVRRVVRLQDALGVMQDAQVAATRLHSLALTSDTELPAATVFTMGKVAERYRRQAESLASTLPEHLHVLQGPQWRKLKKQMERRQSEARHLETEDRGPSPAGDSPTVFRVAEDRIEATPAKPPARPEPPPFLDHVADDDRDWDDDYATSLRSVPTGPRVTDQPPSSERRDDGGAAPATSPSSGQRRKEPVFLPAPPSPGRSGPPPVPEPPGDTQSRTFHDQP
jgi:triphosphatase